MRLGTLGSPSEERLGRVLRLAAEQNTIHFRVRSLQEAIEAWADGETAGTRVLRAMRALPEWGQERAVARLPIRLFGKSVLDFLVRRADSTVFGVLLDRHELSEASLLYLRDRLIARLEGIRRLEMAEAVRLVRALVELERSTVCVRRTHLEGFLAALLEPAEEPWGSLSLRLQVASDLVEMRCLQAEDLRRLWMCLHRRTFGLSQAAARPIRVLLEHPAVPEPLLRAVVQALASPGQEEREEQVLVPLVREEAIWRSAALLQAVREAGGARVQLELWKEAPAEEWGESLRCAVRSHPEGVAEHLEQYPELVAGFREGDWAVLLASASSSLRLLALRLRAREGEARTAEETRRPHLASGVQQGEGRDVSFSSCSQACP